MGARSSQIPAHTDDIDLAIAQLRRRFRLERVRHCFLLACPGWVAAASRDPSVSVSRPLSGLQGTAADRFFHSLSGFIQGLDTKNNVKVTYSDTRLSASVCVCACVCTIRACTY